MLIHFPVRSILLLCAPAVLVAARASSAQQPPEEASGYQPPTAYGQFLSDSFVSPLPPVDDDSRTPARLASFPRDFTEPLLGESNPSVLLPEVEEEQQTPGRDGMFQKVTFAATYLPRLGDNSVGFTDLDVYAVFGFPFPTRESPLLITPGTDFWSIEQSAGFDLPHSLYDNYLEFRWLGKITDRLSADLAVTPGWHTDYFNDNGGDCYRTEAHGVGAWDWSPDLKIALGIAYLDRDDVKLIPAGGIIWTPNDDTRYELVTPRPKIARRFRCDPCVDDWIYVAGEFGGGQWGIQRAGGVEDVLTARDYRLILGVERKSKNLGLGGRAEVGWVFGRVLEYRSSSAEIDLPDTLMARLGISY